jgi:L-iditol 2-dehydrogenase
LEDTPHPNVGPDDILVKVLTCGICGTDLRIWHGGHRKYPSGTVRVPGHEVVGDVVAVGANVRGIQPGQRYIIAPNWGCGHCRQCVTGNNNRCANYGAVGITVDGAFAEFLLVPGVSIGQGNLIPVEAGADPAVASLVEPFACVVRGQEAMGGIRPEDVVVVMGAGPIGVMHTMLARLQGARRVIVSEILPARMEQAKRAGADRVVNVKEEDLAAIVDDVSGGEGADAVIVAAPSPQGQQDAIRIAGIGGRINFFGGLPKDKPTVDLDSNAIHYKELLVTGTTACSTANCWKAAAILQSGRADFSWLISKHYSLDSVLEAFAAAEDRSALKIVVEP